MHHHIAFLRGINLGKRRIKMEQLRECFEALKFAGVETFIASGNVVFSSKAADTSLGPPRAPRRCGSAPGQSWRSNSSWPRTKAVSFFICRQSRPRAASPAPPAGSCSAARRHAAALTSPSRSSSVATFA